MAAARQSLGLGARAGPGIVEKSHTKAVQFFREVARCLPFIVNQYKLDELTSVAELRTNLAKMFREKEGIKNPGVVDLLIYKGREELEMIMMQHKQRHHLIAEYVKNPALDRIERDTGRSAFLEAFYKSN